MLCFYYIWVEVAITGSVMLKRFGTSERLVATLLGICGEVGDQFDTDPSANGGWKQ